MNLFAATGPERSFRELLLEARLRNKFTIADLSMKLGCSADYYETLEEGARVPGERWIPKLSRTLTIPLDQLKDAVDNARAGKTTGR